MIAKIFNTICINILYLSRLLLPLVLLPLISQNYSLNVYSAYVYCISVSALIAVFVDFGFNITGIKFLASIDPTKAFLVVSNIQKARVVIVFVIFPIFLFFLSYSNVFENMQSWVYITIVYGILLGLSPTYALYFYERAVLGSLNELMCTIILLFYIVIVGSNDENYTFGYAMVVIRYFGLLINNKIVRISTEFDGIIETHLKDIFFYLKNSLDIFWSQLISNIYTGTAVFILGYFAGTSDIAIYGTGERMIKAGLGFFGQMYQFLYPKIVRINIIDSRKCIKFQYKLFITFFILAILATFLARLSSTIFANLLLPKNASELTALIDRLSWVILPIAFNGFVGSLVLLVSDHVKAYRNAIIFGAISNCLLMPYMINIYGYNGAVVSWIIVEYLIAVLFSYLLYTNFIKSRGGSYV